VLVEGAAETENRSNNQNTDAIRKSGFSKSTFYSGRVVDVLFIVFLIGYSLVGMRHFELRMANLHEDDGPIFYARAFKNPTLFEGDFIAGFPVSPLVPIKVMTSALIWIPALLWRYLDVNPYITTWLITFLQGLSIGLSIYILTSAMVRNRAVAVLAVIFAYIATPWGWDLANYGTSRDWIFVPYPATMAIAPVLLAFSCLIKKYDRLVCIFLVVSGLIHPNVTIYACAMIGLYWLWDGIKTKAPSVTLMRLTGLAFVVMISISPILWLQATQPSDSLPAGEVIAGMRHNQHLWPWAYESRWYLSISTTLVFSAFAVWSQRRNANVAQGVHQLWTAAFIASCLLGFTQVIGALLQNQILLSLTGFRGSMWLLLLSLPLIMNYWHSRLGADLLSTMMVMICLALPLCTREYAAFWFSPLLIGLFCLDLSKRQAAIFSFDLPQLGKFGLTAFAFALFLIWTALFLTLPNALHWAPEQIRRASAPFIWAFGNSERSARIGFILIVSVLGPILWLVNPLTCTLGRAAPLMDFGKKYLGQRTKRMYPFFLSLVTIFLAAGLLWVDWRATDQRRASSDFYTLDLQLWARNNTPPSSLFVVPSPIGWRTMSLRRRLSPFSREGYSYVATRQAKEYRERLLDFYGISPEEGRKLRGDGVYQLELERFRGFKEKDFLRFASEFGATHLVLPIQDKYTEVTGLALPLIYKNPYYVVYTLNPTLRK
jgi:hypothetical protein